VRSDSRSAKLFSMSVFQKTEGYLGVDLGAGGIKMVELHKTKGRPQLWTYGIAHQALDIHLQQLTWHSETNAPTVPIYKKQKLKRKQLRLQKKIFQLHRFCRLMILSVPQNMQICSKP
jgi:Tfp pilus assembly PilM family ATPase